MRCLFEESGRELATNVRSVTKTRGRIMLLQYYVLYFPIVQSLIVLIQFSRESESCDTSVLIIQTDRLWRQAHKAGVFLTGIQFPKMSHARLSFSSVEFYRDCYQSKHMETFPTRYKIWASPCLKNTNDFFLKMSLRRKIYYGYLMITNFSMVELV